MRRLTKANIRILAKENLPKIASDDDEMVQVRVFFMLCLCNLLLHCVIKGVNILSYNSFFVFCAL